MCSCAFLHDDSNFLSSCNFLGECFLSLLFNLDFFFDRAAPLMVFLQYLLQSLFIAVILEAFIRRPERKVDLSTDVTSKYIAYADYLLHHCPNPSKTDRWVLECLTLMRTDWLPASVEGVVAAAELPYQPSSVHQLQLPSYAFFWEHPQHISQDHHQHQQQQQQRQPQHNTTTYNHPQQHEQSPQQVKKRLKVLPPLRIAAVS
jgi:hypothetical protein